MLGLAGSGEFYLRLSDRDIPALLLPDLEFLKHTGVPDKTRTASRNIEQRDARTAGRAFSEQRRPTT